MIPFAKCPTCGGDVIPKPTEKLLHGGDNLATMTVDAVVCLRCGERLYSADTVHSFEQIRAKLDREQIDPRVLSWRSSQAWCPIYFDKCSV